MEYKVQESIISASRELIDAELGVVIGGMGGLLGAAVFQGVVNAIMDCPKHQYSENTPTNCY